MRFSSKPFLYIADHFFYISYFIGNWFMELSNLSHPNRTRFLCHFKHLEFKLRVFSGHDIPPTESASVLMSGAISNKNRLHECLECVACSGQCCICFSVFSVHMPRCFYIWISFQKTNSENNFNRTTCTCKDSSKKEKENGYREWLKKLS